MSFVTLRDRPTLLQLNKVHIIYAMVILINATTLMHKSTLSTKNFGNNHFRQKYQEQNILGNFRK